MCTLIAGPLVPYVLIEPRTFMVMSLVPIVVILPLLSKAKGISQDWFARVSVEFADDWDEVDGEESEELEESEVAEEADDDEEEDAEGADDEGEEDDSEDCEEEVTASELVKLEDILVSLLPIEEELVLLPDEDVDDVPSDALLLRLDSSPFGFSPRANVRISLIVTRPL